MTKRYRHAGKKVMKLIREMHLWREGVSSED